MSDEITVNVTLTTDEAIALDLAIVGAWLDARPEHEPTLRRLIDKIIHGETDDPDQA